MRTWQGPPKYMNNREEHFEGDLPPDEVYQDTASACCEELF
jgi:hypothetical protein